MRFILRYEKQYSGYRITREEYSDDKNKSLLYIDTLGTFNDKERAKKYFNGIIDRISTELFKVIEFSSTNNNLNAVEGHVIFESNNLSNIQDFYSQGS